MPIPYKKAFHSALRMLGRRDHSAAELEGKLDRRGVEKSVIDRVVAECRRLNYIDDARFAAGLIRHFKRKGCGPQRLRREFRSRGLKGPGIDQLLSDAFNEQEEFRVARSTAIKKLPTIDGSEPAACRARLYRFLYARGFSPQVITLVLHDLEKSSDGRETDC